MQIPTKLPSKLKAINRFNHCLLECGISWHGAVSTSSDLLRASLASSIAMFMPARGGSDGFVTHFPQIFNNFEPLNFSIKHLSSSKEWPVFMEKHRQCSWRSQDGSDSRPQIPVVYMILLSVFVCASQCVSGFIAEWQHCGSTAFTMWWTKRL